MIKKILFTDTHFGTRQNSMTWLKSQLEFIDKNLIPRIQKEKLDNNYIKLIHCGDVFDSRSSISPYVAIKVREKFEELASLVDEFIIVAGNHDFYSPNSDEVDTLSMVFRDCNIKLVVRELYQENEDLFAPWYIYKDDASISSYLKQHPEVKNIYTHADIFHEDFRNYSGVSIFSGHIHQPHMDSRVELFNLGSCYPLDFTDNNDSRHFYMLSDGDCRLQTYDNSVSISFWRLYNEDIFGTPKDILHKENDYYEIYIEQNNMQSQRYIERLSELSKVYKNLCIIPQIKNNIAESEQLESYDINEICKSMIPDHLKDKFKQVEASLN